MSRHIPPRRVPRDRFIFSGGGGSGGVFSGPSVPGAHTHLEADITDLDKFSQAAADARFSPLVHTHVKADITDFAHTHVEADITNLDKFSQAAADARFAALSHTHLEADITDLKAYAELAGAVFTGDVETTELKIAALSPTLKLFDTDEASVDEKNWELFSSFGRITLRARSDDLGTTADVWTVLRLGMTMEQFDIKADRATHNGLDLAHQNSAVNLSLGKASPLYIFNNTGATGAINLHFQNVGVGKFSMGLNRTDDLFKLNIGGSFSRNDFVMNATTGLVSFNLAPTVGGLAVTLVGHTHLEGDITDLQNYSLVGHTHLEVDITDLKAYLVSPLTTAGDLLVFTSVDARLAVGTEGQVLTSTAGNPTWATPASGVTDHGLLTGLGDDDHTQYLLKTGGTMTGDLELLEVLPTLLLNQSGAALDEKRWEIRTVSGDFTVRAVNDAESASDVAFAISRTGIVLDNFNVQTTLLQHNSVDVSLVGHTHIFADLTDSIADGQVPVGAVTQHQAALSIGFAQITGVVDADLLDGLDSLAFSLVGHTHVKADITDLGGPFLALAGGTLTGDLTISKTTPLLILDGTGNTTAGVVFKDAGVDRFSLGYRDADNTFHLNILGSIDGRSDFVMDSTGKVAFAITPVVLGVNVSLAGHTHLEADITDLKAYLVSPLTTAGDILFFNGGHQRLAKGLDTEVLTLAAGVPTWAAPAGGGVTDHGDLTGLLDDDHTQYLLKTGGTLTGTLTTSGAIKIESASPNIRWFETDAAVDEGRWQMTARDNVFQLRAQNDAETTTANFLEVRRTGIVIDSVDFFAKAFNINAQANAVSVLSIGESTTLRGNSQDGQLKIFGENAGAIVFSDITHTGAHLQFNGTGFLQINSMDGLDILAGGILRVRNSSNISRGDWSHDGTSFNLAFTSTADYNLTGLTGELKVDGTGVLLKSGGTLTGIVNIENTINAINAKFTATLALASGSPKLRWDETDAAVDNGNWDLLVSAETMRWRVNTDDFLTNVEFMKVDRTGVLVDTITFTSRIADYRLTTNFNINAEAAVTTFLEIGEPVTVRGDAQGAKLIMWGENNASVLTKFIFNASGGNFGLSSSGTGALQMTINHEVNAGKFLRIRNLGNTDWGQWSHDGTDFTLSFVNTTDYNITGANLRIVNNVGFNNTAPINKPNVLGSRGGNAALAALLNALASYGLITNSTT